MEVKFGENLEIGALEFYSFCAVCVKLEGKEFGKFIVNLGVFPTDVALPLALVFMTNCGFAGSDYFC